MCNIARHFRRIAVCFLITQVTACTTRAPETEAKLKATREYYDSPAVIGVFLDPSAFGLRKWHATFEMPGPNGKMIDETEYLLRYAKLSKESKILDWGCGMGRLVVKLAKKCRCSVTGINISAKQLDFARLWAKQNGVVELVSFVLYDGRSLPFADNSFTNVFSQEALVNAPDKLFAYSQVLRVLKPGGELSIQDWYADEASSDWQKIVRRIDDEHKSTMITIQESERIFKAVGFKNVEVVDIRSSVPGALYRAFPNEVFREALDKKAFTVGFVHASKPK